MDGLGDAPATTTPADPPALEPLQQVVGLGDPSATTTRAAPPDLEPLQVVFDMDETLLHVMEEEQAEVRRPGAETLLRDLYMDPRYEVAFFTAATQEHAAKRLRRLELSAGIPMGAIPRFFTEACGEIPCIKDLRRFRKSVKRSVLIDDRGFVNGICQFDNAVQVSAFTGGEGDTALSQVRDLLEALVGVENVPDALRAGITAEAFPSIERSELLSGKDLWPQTVQMFSGIIDSSSGHDHFAADQEICPEPS